jgi:DNA sulfur modification protein DndC
MIAPRQPTLFDSQRGGWEEAMDITAQSLIAYGSAYRHWAIAYSGGKDSTATVSAVVHLIDSGRVPRPQSLTVLLSDTRMELVPLYSAAMEMLELLRGRGVTARVVLPAMDDRFFVYMLGRGVPPPSNTFRWCTAQLKIEPMLAALKDLRDQSGEKLLMLTGVRVGESAVRDARIALSCGKNGAECGQGWFQEATPEAIADTLAPLLHWRVCSVWDWLFFHAPRLTGLPTNLVAEAYGGDEALEVNTRTGCVGCNLASRDFALEAIVENPRWTYLHPLLRLRAFYAELKRPGRRLRKDGSETRRDGSLVSNPCRMGPLTFDARRWGLDQVQAIEQAVNAGAGEMPRVSLINSEERARILELIEMQTWPRGWAGSEPLASIPFENVNPDGSSQPFMKELLT